MVKKPSFEELLADVPLPVPDGVILELDKVQLDEINDRITTFIYGGLRYRIPTWFARRLAIMKIREGAKKVRVFRPVKTIRGGRAIKTYTVEKLE